LASLLKGWKRKDGTAQVGRSDGYATGLAVLTLQQAGVPATDARLVNGLEWLRSHQSAWTGRWQAYSPNRNHAWLLDESARFMDDAATAYAVLALTQRPALDQNSTRLAAH
jgi:hypothetical protein